MKSRQTLSPQARTEAALALVLHAWRVKGNEAVIQYAELRYTRDLDLWIGTYAINAAAVYKALIKFGAPLASLTEADFS